MTTDTARDQAKIAIPAAPSSRIGPGQAKVQVPLENLFSAPAEKMNAPDIFDRHWVDS